MQTPVPIEVFRVFRLGGEVLAGGVLEVVQEATPDWLLLDSDLPGLHAEAVAATPDWLPAADQE